MKPGAVLPPEAPPVAARDDSDLKGEFVLYDAEDSPQMLTLDFDWNLTPHNYPPGTRIVVIAQATDWYDLGDPHNRPKQPADADDRFARGETARTGGPPGNVAARSGTGGDASDDGSRSC